MIIRARAGLAEVTGQPQGAGFVCPLCLRVLSVDCATLAHAPADAVGGKPAAFLCKRCNSYLGTAFEPAAADQLEAVRVGSLGLPKVVRAGYKGGAKLVARASWETADGAPVALVLDSLGRQRAGIAYAQGQGSAESGLTITYREWAPHVAKLAYLSWAYIAMFATFGYSYVLSPATRILRNALVTGKPNALGLGYWLLRGDFAVGPPEPVAVLHREAPPPYFVGLGVQMGSVIVVTPSAFDETNEVYRTLDGLVSNGELNGLVPMPLTEWYPTLPSNDYLAHACEVWLGEPGSSPALVHTTYGEALAELRTSKAPAAKRDKRSREPAPKPIVPRLRTDLDSSSWETLARREVSAWWARVGGGRPLVLPGTDPGLIKELRRIAPPYLVAHVEEMHRLFATGSEWGPPTESAMGAADTAQVWAQVHGLTISDLHVSDEMIDESGLSQCWLFCTIGADPILIGPYYSAGVLLMAVEHRLEEWLAHQPTGTGDTGLS
jgi:hypothetical protein